MELVREAPDDGSRPCDCETVEVDCFFYKFLMPRAMYEALRIPRRVQVRHPAQFRVDWNRIGQICKRRPTKNPTVCSEE